VIHIEHSDGRAPGFGLSDDFAAEGAKKGKMDIDRKPSLS